MSKPVDRLSRAGEARVCNVTFVTDKEIIIIQQIVLSLPAYGVTFGPVGDTGQDQKDQPAPVKSQPLCLTRPVSATLAQAGSVKISVSRKRGQKFHNLLLNRTFPRTASFLGESGQGEPNPGRAREKSQDGGVPRESGGQGKGAAGDKGCPRADHGPARLLGSIRRR